MTTLEVLFHFDATARLRAWIDARAGPAMRVRCCAEGDDARFVGLLRDCEVLWHSLKPVTPAVIAAAPRLRLVQKIGVGVNTIALDVARARGIRVCNLPGANSRAVAEMTLLLMLACLRRLNALDAAVRAPGGWALPGSVQDTLGEVGGKTVGLVGFGAVPQLVAPWLAAMGARVLYHTRTAHEGAPDDWRNLHELLAESDVVSLHVPLTTETTRLLDASAFAVMRKGAILVNTARGGLVDEPALIAALESGQLGGAGLDVFAEEPLPPNHALLRLTNVITAPHVAWLTPETFERALTTAFENCRRLAAGEPLLHQVV